MARYDYALGFKSRFAATTWLDDAMADSVISEGEKPKVEAYPFLDFGNITTHRFKVTLES